MEKLYLFLLMAPSLSEALQCTSGSNFKELPYLIPVCNQLDIRQIEQQ